jgi:hypothetical protein
MSVTVKVKACADCFEFNERRHDGSPLSTEKMREISIAFGMWEDYRFDPSECSHVDFIEGIKCGICGGSLTGDRRQHNDQGFGDDRRSAPSLDRRSPYNRGSRVLHASLVAA